MGPFQSNASILGMLLLINGFSLTAFFYQNPWWALFHFAFHGVLAIDELRRATKVRARWPFFVNHLGFMWILHLFRGTLSIA